MKQPWVVVSPQGLVHVELDCDSEDRAWTVALGWPDAEEVQAKKDAGWFACPGTVTWHNPKDTPKSPVVYRVDSHTSPMDMSMVVRVTATQGSQSYTVEDRVPYRIATSDEYGQYVEELKARALLRLQETK